MKLLVIICGLLIMGCHSAENKSVNEIPENTIQKEETSKEKELQNGDLIFHTSLSNQSQAIQITTHSKYSHMGIIYKEGENYVVYEAVQPVKKTSLNSWIRRGENGHYVVKRLKNSEKFLTVDGIERMKMIGQKYQGKDYDVRFEWSDDKIYCSELVWKIYKEALNIEIGKLEKIGDFDLSDKTVQKIIAERYGSDIPKDEWVITPDRMFNSEKLITIIEN